MFHVPLVGKVTSLAKRPHFTRGVKDWDRIPRKWKNLEPISDLSKNFKAVSHLRKNDLRGRERERETERQRETETDRQTDRQTETDRQRQIDRRETKREKEGGRD